MATSDTSGNYKSKYAKWWQRDTRLREEYSPDANKIILSELATIIDYETTEYGTAHPMDQKGYDRHVKIDFGWGIRVRDEFWIPWAEFTADEKEWRQNITDPHYYYFFAYVVDPSKGSHEVKFWMIFNYCKLKELVTQGKIKYSIQHNKKHSSVPFFAFKIKDIAKHNLILTYEGNLDVMKQLELPPQNKTRIDRFPQGGV